MSEEQTLRRATFRYVEAELYDYPYTRQNIDSLREDIIDAGVRLEAATLQARVQSNRVYDPTESKGVRLVTNKRLTRMQETVEAIDRVWARLDEDKRRLVELKYWDGRYTDKGIAEQLHASMRTYYRWRQGIVYAVAVEMGLANAINVGTNMAQSRALDMLS
jgi:RinA family phage transcriptional activator